MRLGVRSSRTRCTPPWRLLAALGTCLLLAGCCGGDAARRTAQTRPVCATDTRHVLWEPPAAPETLLTSAFPKECLIPWLLKHDEYVHRGIEFAPGAGKRPIRTLEENARVLMTMNQSLAALDAASQVRVLSLVRVKNMTQHGMPNIRSVGWERCVVWWGETEKAAHALARSQPEEVRSLPQTDAPEVESIAWVLVGQSNQAPVAYGEFDSYSGDYLEIQYFNGSQWRSAVFSDIYLTDQSLHDHRDSFPDARAYSRVLQLIGILDADGLIDLEFNFVTAFDVSDRRRARSSAGVPTSHPQR